MSMQENDADRPNPILPAPIGEDGLVQTGDGARPGDTPPLPPIAEDKRTPGDQERPMTEEEELDEALDDTFPASDPIAPSRIDGPL
ncbi:hypothetical protein [Aureimonas phyllosphaerae]|uniref:Uncharacterized protein n=1 Tax=Aureimonas phyllosphaerae TaxID=1166078 RepID=A0A7W6C295_9HYPH|nr:hypothetical protein [Aureimonas phyllosphaerae]MBB3937152.1 hypothetical protein [Aureimonas phyllosphaerae]MBB3961211.1 hypothetical protein [Aureimonas phyllosphaerae]SFF52303.1 hypothetical protein SAMN05216566_12146 [Aureimonas phyllosphaerae]